MPQTARTGSFAGELGELRASMKAVFGNNPPPEVQHLLDVLISLYGEAEYVDRIRIGAEGVLRKGEVPARFPRRLRELHRDIGQLIESVEGGQGTTAL